MPPCLKKRLISIKNIIKKRIWWNIKYNQLIKIQNELISMLKNYPLNQFYFNNKSISQRGLCFKKFNLKLNLRTYKCKLIIYGLPYPELVSLSNIVQHKLNVLTRYKQLNNI